MTVHTHRIDGKAIAQEILDDLQKKVQHLKKKGVTAHLAIVLIGDDPASSAYVRQKELKAESIGAKSTVYRLPSTVSESELLNLIRKLNEDSNIHGIIVQQPLPSHINTGAIVQIIEPKKDVDGFHPQAKFPMPLAAAVIKILEHVYSSREVSPKADESRSSINGDSSRLASNNNFESWLRSQNIVVIGKGETGGRPVIQALKARGANVVIIDSKTQHPQELTKKATVIISAVGRKNIVTSEMISQEVILISVGLHKGEDGKLHGDYNEEEIASIASFYTPTPGGIGPVNVAMLLENLVLAAQNLG